MVRGGGAELGEAGWVGGRLKAHRPCLERLDIAGGGPCVTRCTPKRIAAAQIRDQCRGLDQGSFSQGSAFRRAGAGR